MSMNQPMYSIPILGKCVDLDVFSARRHIGSDDEYFALLTDFIQTTPYCGQELTAAAAAKDSWLFRKKMFEVQMLLLPMGADDLLCEGVQVGKLAKHEDWEQCATANDDFVNALTRLANYLQSALSDADAALSGGSGVNRNPDAITYDAMIASGAGASVKKQILAVDDMPDALATIRAILKTKYEVFTASQHMGALQVLAHKDPDLVLLDIDMPGKDGFELLKIIRRIRGYEKTPIFFISGSVSAENVRRARALGVTVFLKKPIDPQRLLGKLEQWL